MGFQDSAKKVRAALQKVLAEMPGVQDRFAETGDPTELDAADKTIDRLSSLAHKFSSKLATKAEMASPGGPPPALENPEAAQPQDVQPGPQNPRAALQKAFGAPPAPGYLQDSIQRGEGPGPQEAPPAPMRPGNMPEGADLGPPDARGAVQKAFGRPDAELKIAQAKRENLPEVINQNRIKLHKLAPSLPALGRVSDEVAAKLSAGASSADLFSAKAELEKAYANTKNALTDDEYSANLGEAVRLLNNILRDEAELGKLTAEQKIAPAAVAKPTSAPRAQYAIDAETAQHGEIDPRTGKPSSQTPTGFAGEAPEPEVVAPKVKKDFNGNASAMMGDLEDFAAGSGASAYEREFIRRVNTELGARPKRFTIEKLLTALTVGASAVTSAWITRRYGGQAALDLNQDQRDYDARRAQIGREVWSGIQANQRQDRSLEASMDRSKLIADRADARQANELSFKREKMKADDVVKQFNAKVRYLEMTNRAAARRLHAYGLGIKEQIDTEQGKLRNEAEMVKFDKSKIENYRSKEVEAAQRIAELTADLQSAIENFGEPDDSTVGK